MHRLLFVSLLMLAYGSPLRGEDTERGDKLREAYFRAQVKQIADAALADIKSKEDWTQKRPELRRQYLDMLGLWPMPAKTDLKPTITGKLETDHCIVEKIHFQSAPGLYVTGNLWLPKKGKGPFPTILYVCGHGNHVQEEEIDGKKVKVSYGSKIPYQHHPAWFAEHGYVCLILDTLQLGEIEGIHHGTSRYNMWWWQTVGYTPAGIECWNGIRALDYLESRPEVDKSRMGVTGRSGGGATSWWVGAADERVKAIIPVAGLADMEAHVVEGVAPRLKRGVVTGHCDCMYFLNTYRWDFTQVMALCAPRAVLLGNSDVDDIFPVPGYRRPAAKVRKLYDLLGVPDKFDLLETKGPHKDTPELRLGAFRWMNRWLKDDKGDVKEEERPRLEPKQLRVFAKLPDDQRNTTVHEWWRKPARVDLPDTPGVVKEWWPARSKELLEEVRKQAFRGWPEKAPDLKLKPAEDVKHEGLRLRAYDFVSEDEVELRLWLLTAEKTEKPTLVVLNALDEAGWKEWASDLGPAFTKALQLTAEPKLDEKKFAQNKKVLEFNKWAFAAVAPRGVGPTRWSETFDVNGRKMDYQTRRRFALIGQTLDGQRVWDVRRAVAGLKDIADLKSVPLWLQGKGEMAGIALYAALFEPDVARLDLWHPPASHQQGPTFLNVRKVLDMPQAVALASPRQVKLYVKDDDEAKAWDWPLKLQAALGKESLQIRRVGE